MSCEPSVSLKSLITTMERSTGADESCLRRLRPSNSNVMPDSELASVPANGLLRRDSKRDRMESYFLTSTRRPGRDRQ